MSEIQFIGSGSMSEPISVQLYSDGTPMVKTLGFQRIVEQAHTMVLRPSSLLNFVTAMFLHDAVNHAGGEVENLILPYVPGARQDRSNPTGDVLETAWSVAEMINVRDFSRVVILDPHSPATPNEIVNVMEYPLRYVAGEIKGKWDAVIAPDKGAHDRAREFATGLGVAKVIDASKTRDVSTGRLSGFAVEVEEGNHYMVADDICDGGGTFVGLGEKIREQGATADLFVSHGIFSKGVSPLLGYYNKVYTTDSRPHHDGVMHRAEIIPVVKEMENYNG
jgi:ribose-phosphate pyrophosphokinase